jgi:hypothetical protein
MCNSYKIALSLIFSIFAIPLVSCQVGQSASLSPASGPTPGAPPFQLLPGETIGCSGEVCGLGEPDIDE